MLPGKTREVVMAAERLSMRTIKEVLRLKWEKKLSKKLIAKSCNIARSTIRDYLERAQHAGLNWPLTAFPASFAALLHVVGAILVLFTLIATLAA
jgi:hypothetical protein